MEIKKINTSLPNCAHDMKFENGIEEYFYYAEDSQREEAELWVHPFGDTHNYKIDCDAKAKFRSEFSSNLRANKTILQESFIFKCLFKEEKQNPLPMYFNAAQSITQSIIAGTEHDFPVTYTIGLVVNILNKCSYETMAMFSAYLLNNDSHSLTVINEAYEAFLKEKNLKNLDRYFNNPKQYNELFEDFIFALATTCSKEVQNKLGA